MKTIVGLIFFLGLWPWLLSLETRAENPMPLSALPQSTGRRVERVHVEALVKDHRVQRGKPFLVQIQLSIEKEFHINSNRPKDKFMIPTQITLKETPDFNFKEPQFPSHIERRFEFSPDTLYVFEGEIQLKVPGGSNAKSNVGRKVISGQLQYQACDHTTCYPPQRIPFEIQVEVIP